DHDAGAVPLERPGHDDGAGLDGADLGARLRADPDPVPTQRDAVRPSLRAEAVDEASIDGPIERADVGRRDGSLGDGAAGDGASAALLGTAAVELRDEPGQPGLVSLELGQAPLRLLLACAVALESALLLRLERLQVGEFAELVGAEPLELRQVRGQFLLARNEVRLQAGDLVDQQAVVERDQVKVLVATEQVAKALGAEQDLHGVEWPALVDGTEPARQDDALLGQAVATPDQLARGLLDAACECGRLELDLAEHGGRCRDLALDVGEARADVAHASTERLHLALELLALLADLLEAELALADLTADRVLGAGGCGGQEDQPGDDGTDSPHRSRRCRRTASPLATMPRMPPAASPPATQVSGTHSTWKIELNTMRYVP